MSYRYVAPARHDAGYAALAAKVIWLAIQDRDVAWLRADGPRWFSLVSDADPSGLVERAIGKAERRDH